MDKTERVRMLVTGRTTDIGDFEKGQELKLPDSMAILAVAAGLAEPAHTKPKKEVKPDGGE